MASSRVNKQERKAKEKANKNIQDVVKAEGLDDLKALGRKTLDMTPVAPKGQGKLKRRNPLYRIEHVIKIDGQTWTRDDAIDKAETDPEFRKVLLAADKKAKTQRRLQQHQAEKEQQILIEIERKAQVMNELAEQGKYSSEASIDKKKDPNFDAKEDQDGNEMTVPEQPSSCSQVSKSQKLTDVAKKRGIKRKYRDPAETLIEKQLLAQQRKDPNFFLKEHMMSFIDGNRSGAFNEYLERYIKSGIDQDAAAGQIQPLKDIWVSVLVKPKFFDLVQSYIRNPKSDEVKCMREMDTLTLIDLTFQHSPKCKNEDEENTLFEFLKRMLHVDRMPIIEQLDQLVTEPTDENKEFVCRYWKWCTEGMLSKLGDAPNAFWCYLAQKWGIIAKVAQMSITAEDLKNLANTLASVAATKPSARTKHAHIFDITWAIRLRYKGIGVNELIKLYGNYKMLLHDEVLQALNICSSMTVQSETLDVVVGCVSTQVESSQQFIQILNFAKERLAVMTELKPKKPANLDDRIMMNDFVEICKSAMSFTNVRDMNAFLHKYTTLHELRRRIHEANNWENANIKQDVVNGKVDELMRGMTEKQSRTYGLISKISAELHAAATDQSFVQYKLQDYIVASLVGKGEKIVLGNIPPGTGKTYMFLSIAKFYLGFGMKVKFYTFNKQLEDQFREISTKFLHDHGSLIQIGSSPLPKENEKNVVVLIDEADAWVVDNAAVFTGVNGLQTLHDLRNATRVIMMTATVTPFLHQVLRMLTNKKETDYLMTFKSKAQLCDHTAKMVNFTDRFLPSADEMTLALDADITKNWLTRPLIIFSDMSVKELQSIYQNPCQQKGIDCELIQSAEDACKIRALNKRNKTGLFFVEKEFSRGFDLKMRQDALVLIAMYNLTLSWSQVNQMAGRACRSFGIANAILYSCKLKPGVSAEEILKRNELDVRNGIELLDMLYKNWGRLKGLEHSQIKHFFAGINWCKAVNDVQVKDGAVWRLLRGDSKQEESGTEEISLSQKILAAEEAEANNTK